MKRRRVDAAAEEMRVGCAADGMEMGWWDERWALVVMNEGCVGVKEGSGRTLVKARSVV